MDRNKPLCNTLWPRLASPEDLKTDVALAYLYYALYLTPPHPATLQPFGQKRDVQDGRFDLTADKEKSTPENLRNKDCKEWKINISNFYSYRDCHFFIKFKSQIYFKLVKMCFVNTVLKLYQHQMSQFSSIS